MAARGVEVSHETVAVVGLDPVVLETRCDVLGGGQQLVEHRPA